MPDPDTIRLILVCLSFILVLGTLVKPFCGLIGYLIIMMTRPGLFYPALGEARVELLVGVFLILVMILSGRVKSIRPSDDRTTKLVFILLVVMALSMIQAMDFGTSWDRMHEFLKVFMFFLMIIAFTETEKEIESLLWVFGIVTAFFAYDAIHNYLEGNLVLDIGGDRVDYAVTSGGMGSGHVGLANMIAQGMPVIWYMGVLNKKLLLRLTGILLFCICLYGVVISGSRGGFVGLVTIAACLVVFSKNRLPIILGCLGVFFAVPLVSHSGYMNYIGTILDMGRTTDVSSNSRITGLRNGFEMLLKRPLLGVGPGCYPIARRAWFGWGLWSHNTYGEVMGDLGVPGTIVWISFVKTYMKSAWNGLKIIKEHQFNENIFYSVIVASITRLVLGMATHSIYVFFWYMMAAVVIVLDRIRADYKAEHAPSIPDLSPQHEESLT